MSKLDLCTRITRTPTGLLTLFGLVFWSLPANADGPTPLAESTVGMTGRVEAVVLPGTELEAKPLTDRKTPVVLRVVATYPHGTAFRYDLEYSGLEPGTHDLRDYLRRKDGTPAMNLPPIPVKVVPVLPADRMEPNRLQIETGPQVGGYRKTLIILGIAWGLVCIGLIGSFFFPRRKRANGVIGDKPVSLADRLRPLLDGAVAGTLTRPELAGLERALFAYWRKRLGLETTDPGTAIEKLRRHPEAGPLLAQLEAWLHRPGPQETVDIAALLKPYLDLAPEVLDLGGAP